MMSEVFRRLRAGAFSILFVAVAPFMPKGVLADSAPPNTDVLVSRLEADPDDRQARWDLARRAFAVGRTDIARAQIEHLLRSAQSDADIALLTDALAETLKSDPWDVRLSFAFLPSTNIGRTTENDRFETLLGTFIPQGGGETDSGIGLRYGANVSYARGLTNGAVVTGRASLDRDHYRNDEYGQTRLGLALNYRLYKPGRIVSVEPYLRFRADGEGTHDRSDTGLRLTLENSISDRDRITTRFRFEDRRYVEDEFRDGHLAEIDLGYTRTLSRSASLEIGGGFGQFAGTRDDLSYDQVKASIGYRTRLPSFGGVGAFGIVSVRDYNGDFPGTLTAREDKTARVGVSYAPRQLRIFDARPRLSCHVEQNWSNIALYDYRTTDCAISLERSF